MELARLESSLPRRYVELAGKEAKGLALGMGAREFRNKIVDGTHPLAVVYQVMDDEQRENFSERKMVEFRRLARNQLVREFPVLVADYDRKRATR